MTLFTILYILLIRIQFNLSKRKIKASQEKMNPSGPPSLVERFTSMFDHFNLPTFGAVDQVTRSAPITQVTTLDGQTVSAPTGKQQ